MFTSSSALVVAAMLAASAQAAVVPFAPVTSSSNMVSRALPAACQTICAPAQTDLATCGDTASCLCTNTVAKELLTCAACQYDQDPSVLPSLKTAWSQYSDGCCAAGLCVDVDEGTGSSATSGPIATTSAAVITPTIIPATTTRPAFSNVPSVIQSGISSTTAAAGSSGGDSAGGAAGSLGSGGSPGAASAAGRNSGVVGAGSVAFIALAIAVSGLL